MPFVLDQRLPDDTLFWIMEEDFRFWPPRKDPDYADDNEGEYTILMAAESSGESSGSSLPPSQESNENQGFSQDVVDMMRIATLCHRVGVGNFIWVNSVPRRHHGSACILLTKDGMEAIRGALQRKVLKRGHVD